MSLQQIVKFVVAVSAAGIVALVGLNSGPTRVYADGQDSEQDLVEIGLRIAPDFINMNGKDPNLVGLGSFIVNGQADCNGCHGSDPVHEFLPNRNPYLLPFTAPSKYNQATYLNGGQNFGPVGPGIVKDASSPLFAAPGLGPNIITRNLTPDYTGNPEGGNNLTTFITIMRTGHDFDKLHPNCSDKVTDNCYFLPLNGALLQIMPWAKYQNMTDHQLTAIWTYLSTLPCFAHNDALGNMFPWLKNVCRKDD